MENDLAGTSSDRSCQHVVTAGEVCHLLGPRLALLLPVDPHHLVDGTLDVGFEVRKPAGDLALGEVAVAVVERLELAPVDGNAVALQHADPAAELDELRAGLADGNGVVAPEVGDGLVVGHITSTFQPASRSRRRLDGIRLRYQYMNSLSKTAG